MTTFVKPTEAYQQGQRTLLREYYTTPEIYGQEMERIFSRRWLCVGRAAELADSGDFVLRTVAERASSWCGDRTARCAPSIMCAATAVPGCARRSAGACQKP